MKEFIYTITDKLGIHARPAGMLVKEASKFKSTIQIEKNEKKGDAKKIFSVMSLAIKYDDEIKIIVNGEDENEACEELKSFFTKKL